MALPWFVEHWIRAFAAQKVRETVAEAARQRMSDAVNEKTHDPLPATERPCDVGVVFALQAESGGLEDLLAGVVTIRGQGFSIRQGAYRGASRCPWPLRRRP